jgi:hypothetical protein
MRKGSTLVVVLLVALGAVEVSMAEGPPPAVQELGPVVPTPVPSPERADRIRLITSFTLQNRPDGDSIIAFEATDFQRSGKDQYKTVAAEIYSLVVPKPEAGEIRLRILEKIRDLEWDLLEYVEKVGPPQERESVISPAGGDRPK